MCLLFETIKISEGTPQNLKYHINRIRSSRLNLFGEAFSNDIEKFLSNFTLNSNKNYKLKVLYSKSIIDYRISEYSIIPKRGIKFYELPELKYPYKFVNRKIFEEIEKDLELDEIGIITQNGYLTDATYANIVLFDGTNYYTPDNCLLNGTKRAKLLNEKKICSTQIHIRDLNKYKNLQIINAMIDLEDNLKINLQTT